VRVFVAGASGVIGRPLVAQLVAAGHEVTGRRPLRVPVWIARIVAGKAVAAMSTTLPGASNARVKRELGWEPRWPSWRTGFRDPPR
jgi:2-alkyl-3-oxoalkanoate reductase